MKVLGPILGRKFILIHLIKILDSYRYFIVKLYFNSMVPKDIGLTTFFQNLGGFSYDLWTGWVYVGFYE